jgi:DNA polymerase-1
MVVKQMAIRQSLPSDSEAMEFLDECNSAGIIAVDTETTGLNTRDGRDYIQGVSIGYKKDSESFESFYFPFRHRYGSNYGHLVQERVRKIIESAPTIVFHNAKFDIVALRQIDIQTRSGSWIDTMLMAHLINENWPYSKSLDTLAQSYLSSGHTKQMPEEVASIVNNKALGWAFVPSHYMFDYGRIDAEVTLELFFALWPKFTAEGLENFWPHKARLIEVVIEMESRGVKVNMPFVESMIDAAEQAIQDYGDMFGGNPGSAKFLQQKLLEELHLPVVKRSGKTGKPSFDREAMRVYEQILTDMGSPIADDILAYRGWVHAKGLFYEPYKNLVSPDGRIRPSYKHHKDSDDGGTVTGRLSCADPNLQQIPRVSNKSWNGRVKRCFTGSDGFTLWEADYSQLELRLGTAYANEQYLKEVFRDGRDIFTELSQTLGWDRQHTKSFVYSTQYGAGKTRISHVFGVSENQAQALINQYYNQFPRFKQVSESAKNKCLVERKLRLWSGRYRHFANPREENHKAFNSLIQGGAADIVERVMVRLFDTVDQQSNGEVRMLLQVHDSVIFEIKNGREEYWKPAILSVMEDVNNICVDFDVRFAVDFHKFGGD